MLPAGLGLYDQSINGDWRACIDDGINTGIQIPNLLGGGLISTFGRWALSSLRAWTRRLTSPPSCSASILVALGFIIARMARRWISRTGGAAGDGGWAVARNLGEQSNSQYCSSAWVRNLSNKVSDLHRQLNKRYPTGVRPLKNLPA
ncbi:hypothetical protein Acr_28g0006630 [Actinidia rufa]|uniref:Uncharacterized protein n=1 Tax=Actinidia rufa TaxID=165716 RepID=A0A7J0HAB6_9ERIC|nr:hypothetical protein Acr_28g0006630 [Actinidia rufa]